MPENMRPRSMPRSSRGFFSASDIKLRIRGMISIQTNGRRKSRRRMIRFGKRPLGSTSLWHFEVWYSHDRDRNSRLLWHFERRWPIMHREDLIKFDRLVRGWVPRDLDPSCTILSFFSARFAHPIKWHRIRRHGQTASLVWSCVSDRQRRCLIGFLLRADCGNW